MDGFSAAGLDICSRGSCERSLELRRRFIDAPDELQRLLIRTESLAFESQLLLETKERFSDNDFDTPESRIPF